ncbi:hypothetical protein ABEF92_005093 [Exophiala dermatitidis]|uniref:Glycerate dehydrogenase n=1 Tax=Exophiala dermatitidis (strain ATCC 34100 / CBS 525.76 / NIH/UT8656) TaxID=858893 RepID=H6C8K7_EXODN|nr:glycerate dehydrogenase [Exophiala dermatitidis NIH/UT8656]EHY60435.1 glycerate dehydrogenase [Exophiala dermatitidis NIH/UT8656]
MSSSSSSSAVIKLAILDDYAGIAPAHFQRLTPRLGLEIHTFPETLNIHNPDEHDALVQRLQPYSIISSMRERTRFPRSLLEKLPTLKLLLTTGGRNAAIDTEACKELGIRVVGTGPKPNAVPGYDSTNEQTWALILGLLRNVVEGDTRLKTTSDKWQTDQINDTQHNDHDNSGLGQGLDVDRFSPALVSTLAGKTLSILGLGRLGTQAAVTGALGFGMRVLAWSSSLTQAKADSLAASRGLPAGSFEVASSKDELFRRADVLSVHYVLSERSRGIVSKHELSLMKPTAILVNTSRGPLVTESDLVDVLEKGAIRGAALDVFDTEPLPKDSPWRKDNYWGKEGRSRLLLSPHLGYADLETMHHWYDVQASVVDEWLARGGQNEVAAIKSGPVIV